MFKNQIKKLNENDLNSILQEISNAEILMKKETKKIRNDIIIKNLIVNISKSEIYFLRILDTNSNCSKFLYSIVIFPELFFFILNMNLNPNFPLFFLLFPRYLNQFFYLERNYPYFYFFSQDLQQLEH